MRKLTYEFVKKFFDDNGCVLLDKVYTSNRIKLSFVCKCGKAYARNFDSFKKFPCCRQCGYRNASEENKYTQKEVAKFFAEQNCKLIGEYKNCKAHVVYECICGLMACVSFDNFKKGRRCKNCKLRGQSGENHWAWIKDREKLRLKNLFRKKCYKALSTTLKSIAQNKKTKTHELLGYTSSDLQEYIINHPNWNNVKNYSWHLDHIYPIKAFIDYGISNIKVINCLNNLQPLICKDNLSKSDKYSKKDFEEWLKIWK